MRTTAMLLLTLAAAWAQDVGYEPGQLHPDFELPRLNGKLGKLSDFRGKPVVLINFASW
ncbi:MAG: peroxiredoxin family protein [Planctomycetota bacterium]|jgi:hypothetical protein